MVQQTTGKIQLPKEGHPYTWYIDHNGKEFEIQISPSGLTMVDHKTDSTYTVDQALTYLDSLPEFGEWLYRAGVRSTDSLDTKIQPMPLPKADTVAVVVHEEIVPRRIEPPSYKSYFDNAILAVIGLYLLGRMVKSVFEREK